MESYSAGQGPDNHAVVVRPRHRVDQLHVEVAEDGAPDGLDLQVGEVGTQAAMPPSPKTDERERPLLVLVPRGLEPVRLEIVGPLEQIRKLMLETR